MPKTEDARPTRTGPESTQLFVQQIIENTDDGALRSVAVASPTQVERTETLIESLNRITSVQQRLDVLLHASLGAVPAAQQGTLYLCGADHHSFVVGATSNSPNLVGWEIHADGGYVDAVAHVQYPVLIADVRTEGLVAYPAQPRTARCALAAPFIVGGRTVGVLVLENCEQPGIFTDQDLNALSALAEQTAFVVDHSRLLTSASIQLSGRSCELDAWRTLAEKIPTGIILAEPRRRHLWANKAFYAMSGIARDELGDKWEGVSELLSVSIKELCQHQDQATDLTLACRNAPQRQVRVVCQQLDDNGIHRPDSYLLILEDLSEKQLLERKLFHMQRLSNVGALLSSVSHEINNPLTSVLGYAELILARDDIPLQARDDLSTIVHQAERSVRVARDLLDYVRLREDGPSPLDLNHLVRQLVRFRACALSRDSIEVNLSLADDLPLLVGNARQIQQVLLNLISNAEHAMQGTNRPGKLWIRTRWIEREHCVRLSVRDNGSGIPPELESQIFEPFFTTKPSGEGTGLGLSISRQIVEQHRGRIELENRPGRGATFCIILPASGSTTSVTAAQDHPASVSLHPTSARILVVDDEQSIRDLLSRILTRDGHRVDVAWSGSKAIHQMEQTAYDIVFLDLKIPGLSGQAVYSWIKRDRPQLAQRTVILTGDTLSGETLAFLKQEQVKHLLKPFQVCDLRAAVREIWSQRG